MFTRYKYLLIEARNADIKQQLAEKYTDLFPAGGLNVFCVSNKDYQCYLELGAEAYAPAIEGSGVPRLRQFCHSIPARAQYRATNQFLEIQLMSLVQSLELWLKSGVRRKGPKLPSKDFCVKLRDVSQRDYIVIRLVNSIRILNELLMNSATS